MLQSDTARKIPSNIKISHRVVTACDRIAQLMALAVIPLAKIT
jgi:hypothetical protein